MVKCLFYDTLYYKKHNFNHYFLEKYNIENFVLQKFKY